LLARPLQILVLVYLYMYHETMLTILKCIVRPASILKKISGDFWADNRSDFNMQIYGQTLET